MTAPRVLTRAEIAREIHNAACRSRKQGLVCGTCGDLDERAVRSAVAPVEGR